MNYFLIGILLFLTSINLASGLKGKTKEEKIKAILVFVCFFILFGAFMVFFTFSVSELLENPIVQNIIK